MVQGGQNNKIDGCKISSTPETYSSLHRRVQSINDDQLLKGGFLKPIPARQSSGKKTCRCGHAASITYLVKNEKAEFDRIVANDRLRIRNK